MQSNLETTRVSNKAVWAGWILTALAVLLLLFDAAIKVLQATPAVEATTQLGYAESVVLGIGLLELICLVIYVIPVTSVLGAILLTGYLGGAVATHVRAGSDLFSIIFPVLIGLLIWGGLFWRDSRLRALTPLRR